MTTYTSHLQTVIILCKNMVLLITIKNKKLKSEMFLQLKLPLTTSNPNTIIQVAASSVTAFQLQ